MKLLKKLSALIATVAVLSSTAFAADLKFDDKITIAPADTQVTVKLTATAAGTINAWDTIVISYDTDIYDFNSVQYYDEATADYDSWDEDGLFAWSAQGNGSSVNANDVLVAVVFDIVNGSADGTEFSIDYDESQVTSDFNIDDIAPVVVEVKSADPQPGDIKTEEKTFEGETTKKYLEIYDQKTQPRYVVIDTISSIEADDTSVLKATYGDEEKTAKLFDLLTVEYEDGATGGITIGNLTIKMVLPFGSPEPTKDGFSFAVEKE